MEPLISIIVPVYNAEMHLVRCLDSIIGQTLLDIEIICINDGSTDNSSKILHDYALKDSRIKVFNQANGGSAHARNNGLKLARGAFVGFVDSDDWIDTMTYETALHYMTDDIDLVCWNADIFADDDIDTNYLEHTRKYHRPKLNGKYACNVENGRQLTVTVWNKLFRLEIIRKNNICYPKNLIYDDDVFFGSIFFIRDNFILLMFVSTIIIYGVIPL